MELQQIDVEVRKIVVDNGGRHPCSSNALLYLPRCEGGKGLRSVEMEYKVTKIKVVKKLYSNKDPAIKVVREFEERAEQEGRRSVVKEAIKFAEELSVNLDLEDPKPVKKEVRRCQVSDVRFSSKAESPLRIGGCASPLGRASLCGTPGGSFK